MLRNVLGKNSNSDVGRDGLKGWTPTSRRWLESIRSGNNFGLLNEQAMAMFRDVERYS